MTAAERGLLLLCSRLGDRTAHPLTLTQFYILRMQLGELVPPDREARLTVQALRDAGIGTALAARMMALLSRESVLELYLSRAARFGIGVVTRLSPYYPDALEEKLGKLAPPVLYCRGDVRLLSEKCVGVVGSRQLLPKGRDFARKAGTLAAQEGYTLVSGNAQGADRTAQEACLRAGGSVVVFTPQELTELAPQERVLYCSEDGFEEPFSAGRALARNRLIHALGEKTLVAQSSLERGGTWHGSAENLKNGWSALYVCEDGSEACGRLCAMGAIPVSELTSIRGLEKPGSLFDM